VPTSKPRLPSPRQLVLALALSSLLPGCVTSPVSYAPPVAESVRASARLIEVVPLATAPGDAEPRLSAPVGRGKHAAKESATGAGAGLATGVLLMFATGPLGPAVATVMIPALTIGGAATGAAAGWSKAIPAEDARAAEQALARSRDDLSNEIAQRIAGRLASVGRHAKSADVPGQSDLRIEVSIDRWGLAGGAGPDPLTGFFIAASYKVSDARGTATVAQGSFLEGGPQRTISEWTRGDAELLTRAVDATLSRAAETIVDATFLVHDFHVERASLSTPSACGLKPISPRATYHLAPYESHPEPVASLTPLLVWESFPRMRDVEEGPADLLAQVSDVRYDLRVWNDERGGPGDVAYERTGLALAPEGGTVSHRLEAPLAAASKYLWSVRARFRLDGEERITRWSHDMFIDVGAIPLGFLDRYMPYSGPRNPYESRAAARRRDCRDDSIPPLHYLSFTTP
jgi:hypothetical protein